jgi:two-component system, cell cycle response regulator
VSARTEIHCHPAGRRGPLQTLNDTLGYIVGDEVLIEIGARLTGAVRSYDFVGRFGGEEFLVVLNGCDPAFGPGRGEEIRKLISSRPIETAKGFVSVTMSFGLLQSTDWGAMPLERLLHAVDLALYQAKGTGRDCLRIAKPEAKDEWRLSRNQILSAAGAEECVL